MNRLRMPTAGFATIRTQSDRGATRSGGQRRWRLDDLCLAAPFDLGPARPAFSAATAGTGPHGELRRVGRWEEFDRHGLCGKCRRGPSASGRCDEAGSPVGGRAYFISQGEPVNCWQWIDELLGLAGLPPLRRSIPTKLAWFVGAVLERYHRWFYPDEEPRMTRFLAAATGTIALFRHPPCPRRFGYRQPSARRRGWLAWADLWPRGNTSTTIRRPSPKRFDKPPRRLVNRRETR